MAMGLLKYFFIHALFPNSCCFIQNFLLFHQKTSPLLKLPDYSLHLGNQTEFFRL